MRKTCVALVIGLSFLAGADRAAAQDGGMGGFIDWLHKLSGPQFVGGAGTWYQGLSEQNGLRIRVSAGYRSSINSEDEIDPDDKSVSMLTVSPVLEYPFGFLNLEASAGVELIRFGGDSDGFNHVAFPVLLQWRPPVTSELFFRAGVGLSLFPSFSASDFEPLTVDVSRDGAELVFRLILGLEWEHGSWFN